MKEGKESRTDRPHGWVNPKEVEADIQKLVNRSKRGRKWGRLKSLWEQFDGRVNEGVTIEQLEAAFPGSPRRSVQSLIGKANQALEGMDSPYCLESGLIYRFRRRQE